jgi:hypothetical protein
VAAAVKEIKIAFPKSKVEATEDGEGGAVVVVDPIEPGEIYRQRASWIGFRITFQYPASDVYPHFVRGDLARIDGKGLGEGMSVTTFEGRPAVQISRRSNRLNPATDTAAFKLHKVLAWLRSR